MSKNTDSQEGSAMLLVVVSCPVDQTDNIAIELLESRLASCINIIPQVKSYYRWKGKVQQDNEAILLIKCPENNYPRLEKRILVLHPYELPEIITVSVAGGLEDYLNWVLQPDKNEAE